MAKDITPRRKGKMRRLLLLAAVAVLVLLGTFAFLLPYLLKHHIEQHSEEWIGRRVTIDHIVLNPFTFTYAVNGVRCLEPGSTEVFVSWKEISVKCDLWSGFLEHHWRFRQLRIRDPYIQVFQEGDRFNFSDLIELGASGTATNPAEQGTTRFSMENIQLSGGRIRYAGDLLKSPIGISDLEANCTRITSDNARMDFDLHFTIDGGGEAGGRFMIDTDRSLYAVHADIQSFALAPLLPYLQDFLHTTELRGDLDLALDLEDSWADTAALAAKGSLVLNQLAITDGAGNSLIGLQQGRVVLDTLNAKDQLFKLGLMRVDGFSTRYQQWADGSNTWTKALKLDTTTTAEGSMATLDAEPGNVFLLLADYIRLLGQEFVANQYTADSVSVVNASVEFEDFTPEQPVRFLLDQLAIRSSRISTATGTADFTLSTRLNGRGSLNSTFRFDPKNFHNVVAAATVKDLYLPHLDGYSRWYAAHPLTSGILGYAGTTSIQDGRIDSRNHLWVDNLRFGKQTAVHDTGIHVLPLRLGTALLRDVHGMIDLDIPVRGDLNDPAFKPWPIVWKVMKNLVVKAVAAPVRLVGGMLGDNDEGGSEEVRFPSLGTALGKEQCRALDALALLLKEKPELRVAMVPLAELKQETENWAAWKMKQAYLGLQAPLTATDSLRLEELSMRDSSFAAFLNTKVAIAGGASERERCLLAVGAEPARQAVGALEEQRQQVLRAYLERAGVPQDRMTFRAGTVDELAGRTGAPGFRFVVDVGG
ncbi:MAG: DUF748 domain-containing protein [Flavobacteriales bacterium]|nr:DUF748 domain-containing protein [Flavobacteriales bacterium]MBP9079522.1 DUF748 domain-containing protein [Flavobacteriales bacterium]